MNLTYLSRIAALAAGLLWSGCISQSDKTPVQTATDTVSSADSADSGDLGDTSDSGDSGDSGAPDSDTGCPNLRGTRCGTSYNLYMCDACGQVWLCGLYHSGSGAATWGESDYPCECVAEDGTIRERDPDCQPTY